MDGPSPWFGTLIQGGSFAVIVYLIVYQWPKSVERLVKSHDDAVRSFGVVYDKAVETFDRDFKDLVEKTNSRCDALARVFQDEQKFEREHCDRLHKEAMLLIDKNHQAVSDSIKTTRHEVRGHFQTVMNGLAVRRRGRSQPQDEDPGTRGE